MAGILFLLLALVSCPYPLSLLFSIGVHEGGHLLCARLFKWGKPRIKTHLTGFRLSYSGTHSLLSSFAVSMAGSATGIIASMLPFFPEPFRLYSLGLALLNLLPISSLDGGGALLAVLEAFMLPDRAYRICRRISVASVLMLCFFSLAIQLKIGANPTLLAVSVYITVNALAGE